MLLGACWLRLLAVPAGCACWLPAGQGGAPACERHAAGQGTSRTTARPRVPPYLPHARPQRMTASAHAMVVGTTHRYRSKYVTTIM